MGRILGGGGWSSSLEGEMWETRRAAWVGERREDDAAADGGKS